MDEHASMVTEIDDRGDGLTKWEVDFIARMVDRTEEFGDKVRFTDWEKGKIEEIYNERV